MFDLQVYNRYLWLFKNVARMKFFKHGCSDWPTAINMLQRLVYLRQP